MSNFIEKLAKTMDNIENGNSCPMFQKCRAFLPSNLGYDCINGTDVCSKSEMIKINILIEILESSKSRGSY